MEPRRCLRWRARAPGRPGSTTSSSPAWSWNGSTCRPLASTRSCAASGSCWSSIRPPRGRRSAAWCAPVAGWRWPCGTWGRATPGRRSPAARWWRWGTRRRRIATAPLGRSERVVRSGGGVALAVWDVGESNPWATIPGRALVALGHAAPPDRDGPGMFALAVPGALAQLLEAAGFEDIDVQTVSLDRSYTDLDAYLQETHDLSFMFRESFDRLTQSQRADVRGRIGELAESYTQDDGSVQLPGSALVAGAGA